MSKDDTKVSTHKSFHASGNTNMDYKGKSGTEHYHERMAKDGTKYVHKKFEMSDGTTITQDSRAKDSDVWKKSDGTVYRGGKK